MKSWRPNSIPWGLLSLIIAVSVGYLMLIFFPKMHAIRAIRTQIREKQNYIDQCRSLDSLRKQTEKQIEDARVYVVARRGATTKPGDLTHLYSKISQLAKAYGILTNKFEPRPALQFSTFSKAPLVMGVSGPIADVHALLAEIESLPNSLWIASLNLERMGEDEGNVKCEIELAVFIDSSEISN